ncbi:MAG: hypothetical protein PHS64_05615, partial [Candidatus Omnitrophica bacterium]|nr:hypothetical protein [Candidatus Omnitrophota bacterium]
MMKRPPLNTALRAARKCCRMVFDTNSAYWFEKDLGGFAFAEKPRIPVRVDHSIDETVAWIESSGEQWMRNPREFSVARNEKHIYAALKHNDMVIG